jgi:hypothetical protein
VSRRAVESHLLQRLRGIDGLLNEGALAHTQASGDIRVTRMQLSPTARARAPCSVLYAAAVTVHAVAAIAALISDFQRLRFSGHSAPFSSPHVPLG